jgi:hypothetical protein
MGLSEAIQRPVLAYADAAKRRHADRLRATAAAAPSLRHFDRCMRNYARPANIGVAGNANSTQPYLWDIEPDLSLMMDIRKACSFRLPLRGPSLTPNADLATRRPLSPAHNLHAQFSPAIDLVVLHS